MNVYQESTGADIQERLLTTVSTLSCLFILWEDK